ncbi:MAG: hypothetical protein ACRC92_26800 [Peptostreptococcaceae bacterium]
MNLINNMAYKPTILDDCVDLGVIKYSTAPVGNEDNDDFDLHNILANSIIDCIVTRFNTAVPLPFGFDLSKIKSKDEPTANVFKKFINSIYRPISNADMNDLIMSREVLDENGLMLSITVHHTCGLTAIYKSKINGEATLFITDALCFNVDIMNKTIGNLFNINDIMLDIFKEIAKKIEYRGSIPK